jgi:hypothetical protein
MRRIVCWSESGEAEVGYGSESVIEGQRGSVPLYIHWFSYHCPQRRSILARPTRDGRLRKLILLAPGCTCSPRPQHDVLAPG